MSLATLCCEEEIHFALLNEGSMRPLDLLDVKEQTEERERDDE